MHNSSNEDQNKLDQKKKTEMEDSSRMTILFLRARLQSERSVSKTARQRADELAKRVVELEEQLKAVTLQRKKAEKVTAEILAVLDEHGFGDFSQTFDSSSDQEHILDRSKEGTESSNKLESSMISEARMNELEEFSGLELRGSSESGRSLSWTSCPDTPTSLYMDQARRKRGGFNRGGSSSRRNLDRSCRQLKRKEMRSGADEADGGSFQQNQGSGESKSVEVTSNGSKNGQAENKEDRYQDKEAKGFLEDVERALEHQAQLIVRYEAEENAQREWEANFTENINCVLDSSEVGNQSDVTEERDEIRPETVDLVDMIPSQNQVRSEAEYVCHGEDALGKPLVNGVLPTVHSEMGCLPVQQQSSSSSSSMVDEVSSSFSFPRHLKTESNSKEKEKLDLLGNSLHQPLHGSSEHHPAQKSSSHVQKSFRGGESSFRLNKPEAVSLHETKGSLEGVLEALQHAKSSLEHKINRFPLSSQVGPMVRATSYPFPEVKARDAVEVPVGFAGLFRVPKDLKFETIPHNSQISLLKPFSDSHLSSTSYTANVGVGGIASDRYSAKLYLESGPSRSPQNLYIDPYMDMSSRLPASSRHTYPSYADLVPRMPSGYGDGSQRQSIVGTAIPSVGQYYRFPDQVRPNLHR